MQLIVRNSALCRTPQSRTLQWASHQGVRLCGIGRLYIGVNQHTPGVRAINFALLWSHLKGHTSTIRLLLNEPLAEELIPTSMNHLAPGIDSGSEYVKQLERCI